MRATRRQPRCGTIDGQQQPAWPGHAGPRGFLWRPNLSLWTALPNGVRSGGDFLGVTVFVSPRLSTDGPASLPLTSFPAFANWPSKALADVKLTVEVEGLGVLDAPHDPASTAPDPATWQLVFGGDVGDQRRVPRPRRPPHPHVPRSGHRRPRAPLYADVAGSFLPALPPVTTGPLAHRWPTSWATSATAATTSTSGSTCCSTPSSARSTTRKRGRYILPAAIPAGERRRFAFLQAYRFYDRSAKRQEHPRAVRPDRPEQVHPDRSRRRSTSTATSPSAATTRCCCGRRDRHRPARPLRPGDPATGSHPRRGQRPGGLHGRQR